MSWSWRTKPRSIIKTVQWFPEFAALRGMNWDDTASGLSKLGKTIHPVRRMYIYNAHGEDDTWLSSVKYKDYLSGQKDLKETESNGRNDKTTFEFLGFGYVDKTGRICVTEVGNRIVNGVFDSEDYLKQLLKLRVPNETYSIRSDDKHIGVFPFELILRAFSEFESLSRSELGLLFGCDYTSKIEIAMDAIREFKDLYSKLNNKNQTSEVKSLFQKIYVKHYGNIENKVESYYDYAEALSRTLVYTGLFSMSGRSIASKIRVSEHSRTKVRMLKEKYVFEYPDALTDLDEYMKWYGNSNNVKLPWDNVDERRYVIAEKAAVFLNKVSDNADNTEYISVIDNIKEIVEHAEQSKNINDLKDYENIISDAITNHNEEYFIKVASKTEEERSNILEKFDDILNNDDMSALWLEVNTWKSLIAINGEQTVKRNFNVEDDLSPRSFAPGIGNTPDMELYKNGYIIVPEVSLMTGVRQWEHEASSVIDHVLSFINEYTEKQVLGLFLSSRMNIRTVWQFFVLNRESWVGRPVPVIPLTINQYVEVIRFLYEKSWDIDEFKNLLQYIASDTYSCSNYSQWEKNIENSIEMWKRGHVA